MGTQKSIITALVSGAKGKMGQASMAAIEADAELQLLAGIDREDDLQEAIARYQPDVVVDFTVADVAVRNTRVIIEAGVCPVIGTSGFQEADVRELQELSAQRQLGGVIAPNFAIGAVLMMQFAEKAARYFETAEIIERHHEGKKDAPSGTAVKTAEMMAAVRKEYTINAASGEEEILEVLPHARGADYQGIRLHSVRCPGVVAEQEVLLGSSGQTLRIEHRSIDRESFMPGVVLACKQVVQLDGLVYGLENLL